MSTSAFSLYVVGPTRKWRQRGVCATNQNVRSVQKFTRILEFCRVDTRFVGSVSERSANWLVQSVEKGSDCLLTESVV